MQRGLKTMFAGASGTGKSMAAALVAKTLALDLHRVELAGIVSKYIGETEKNLDRVFDAARSGNAILFFDEADALFGKRSEVKDAHDRYANIEIAYLLQKMEDHDGVVILATNLANNIDTAFSRRMHFVVEFPLPDEPRRERLWRGMFPPQAPRGRRRRLRLPGAPVRVRGRRHPQHRARRQLRRRPGRRAHHDGAAVAGDRAAIREARKGGWGGGAPAVPRAAGGRAGGRAGGIRLEATQCEAMAPGQGR